MSRHRVLAATLALLTLVGCSSTPECTPPDEPYLGARDENRLRVPGGMTSPDRSAALVIPEKDAQTAANRASPRKTACLDSPPSYFGVAGTAAGSPDDAVADWAQAWADRNGEALLSMYSTQFESPTQAGSAAWLEQRREEVAIGPLPSGRLEELKITPQGPERRIATFVQRFATNAVHKELTLVRESGAWRIVAERVIEVK